MFAGLNSLTESRNLKRRDKQLCPMIKRNLFLKMCLYIRKTGISKVLVTLILLAYISCNVYGQVLTVEKNHEKRVKFLEHLLLTFNSDKDARPQEAPIWEHWLNTTGALPPDFDELQTNAFPPELLRFENGRTITASNQWPERAKEIRKILDEYTLGHWPPPPAKIAIKYLETGSEENDLYIKKHVLLSFAPSIRAVKYAQDNHLDNCAFLVANLNVDIFVPKGKKGPFPAIIEYSTSLEEYFSSQDKERLSRGYIVCRFNEKDADLISTVYVDYDCTQLEWWAYATSRCVDFLYTLDNVDKSKIVAASHSRGAKTALLAAVMDERISAIIDSHPGTGGGSFNLWRYSGNKFGGETLEISSRLFPYWNNPKMRFFIGRENKIPFDSHFLLALMAPRPCLMGTGQLDKVGEVWGDQQCYQAVKKVYQLLGKEQNLGFYASPGGHEVTAKMNNDYLDWLDMQLGRKPFSFKENLVYTYNFDDWKKTSNMKLNISNFPEKDLNDILLKSNGGKIKSQDEWKAKSVSIRSKIKLIIGDIPTYNKIQKADIVNKTTLGDSLIKEDLPIDEKLIAHLTFPAKTKSKIPVVIYLHAYLDANGYNWSNGYGYSTSVADRIAQNGIMAVEFDQFGYGLRNRDSGIEFYIKNPKVSALGIMICDVKKVIDALSLLDWVDKDKIMVSGYSLGGMVGLYAALYDQRIKAVASTCGFGSMRMDVHGNQTEGIKRYSHLRPTIPALGLFLDNEKRIPYDFHEVLALIAPRPVFILAPKLDQDWFYEDVEICYKKANEVYELFGHKDNLVMMSPNDFNRFPPEYQESVNKWLAGIAK
jgi:cephalosporin-C deacetylase-like acetyl esterase